MTYKVVFADRALKELKGLDGYISIMILAWIRRNLEGSSNPRQKGKELTAGHSVQWLYHTGEYRLPAEIQQDGATVLLLDIRHRKDIYKALGGIKT